MTADVERWDLTLLYAGPDDPGWEGDLEESSVEAARFRQDFRGRLTEESLTADQLAEAIGRYEEIQRRLLRPSLYAQLLFAADTGADRNRALVARARERHGAISETLLFFELELLRLSPACYARLLQDPRLSRYGHWLNQLRAHAPYILSEKVEQALKRKDLSGREAFVQLFEEQTAAFRFLFLMPGEDQEREVTGEELLSLLYHPDRDIRESAFSTFLDRHAEHALVLTSCFNNLLLDHGKECDLRGYPDPMTPTLLDNETEAAIVDRLMEVTQENYGLARDYFRLKRQLLGLDRLKNTDLYAPLEGEVKAIPFSEAKKQVLTAFADFAPEMAEGAAQLLSGGRIDLHPRPGKAGGAFCMGLMPGPPPYILLNYTGTLRDLTTLAHELGHGVHYLLSGGQHLFDYHATLPFAETASVFGELVVTRHLLDREKDPFVKVQLLAAKLEEIIATTFRQNVLTRFEQAAHRRRREGLLSADDFCRLWWQENAKLFGDEVEMIPPYRWGWSYISHFIHARFYCYSYIFGELLVLSLYQKYREEGAVFVPKYLELLAKGGSQPPRNLLAPLGIDLDDPAFWQKGYGLVRELLAELQALVAEVGSGA